MVTYGWVAATYDSIDVLNRVISKHPLKIPLLIIAAGRERVVSNKAIRKFVSASDNCRLVVIKDARHEILQETDHQRSLFWQAFDEFMGP
jgi:lysophospholipase